MRKLLLVCLGVFLAAAPASGSHEKNDYLLVGSPDLAVVDVVSGATEDRRYATFVIGSATGGVIAAGHDETSLTDVPAPSLLVCTDACGFVRFEGASLTAVEGGVVLEGVAEGIGAVDVRWTEEDGGYGLSFASWGVVTGCPPRGATSYEMTVSIATSDRPFAEGATQTRATAQGSIGPYEIDDRRPGGYLLRETTIRMRANWTNDPCTNS